MSGEFPFATKLVSPVKCNEKPWDLWVSEIGHSSPRRDEDGVFPAPETKGVVSARRVHDAHPYKVHARYRRAGLNRLKYDNMNFHGLFPQIDNLNAAVCHMCGLIVKCSAAYRHLVESHNSSEPLLPPPPPAPTIKHKSGHSRSRHKKEIVLPPPPIDVLPVKMETSPIHTATAPLSRIVLTHPELRYLEEPTTSTGVTGEVQVCVASGELPVVSIQDTEELPLGENLNDIVDIMNSEGIQSADDIINAADWKNIIRDIGNLQDINFQPTTDTVQPQELYTPVDSTLSAYAISDADLSNMQFAPTTSPMLQPVIDTNVLSQQALKPAQALPATASSKSQRSKTSKSKFNSREYDPNKHCGVVTADNPRPCTRSLTCKAHALSLRRTVEGRSKSFDTLLAEHRASRDASAAAAPAPAPLPLAAPVPLIPPHLVSTSMSNDLTSFINDLTAEQQVNDIYESLLSVEDPNSIESSITSLLNQPLPADSFLFPEEAEIPQKVPATKKAPVKMPPPPRIEEVADEGPPPLVPADVCWYSSCPRPLALCTFNASHAGGAVTLGKKFATVRSNIKSSLSRSQCKATGTNNFYYNTNTLLSKSVHMNSSSKTNKPEVRKLIVTCSATSGTGIGKEPQQSLSELLSGPEVRHTLNGHVGHLSHARPASQPDRRRPALKTTKRPSSSMLDLGFSLDPLLADEKC